MIMLMTLSHCVVVKASLVFGSAAGFSTSAVSTSAAGVSTSAAGDSTSTAGDFAAAFAFLCEDDISLGYFLFCSSLACRVFSAAALPAATRFGFLIFVTGVFEVTC